MMSRTELQELVIFALKESHAGTKYSIRQSARVIARNLGISSLQQGELRLGIERVLRGCYRDGVTSEEDVSGRVADWIQDITS